jgi:hypothetical protein
MAGSTSEIRKGMPGLKQAGKIANDRLTKHLAKFGYTPVPHSLPGNTTRDIVFALVDDFGVGTPIHDATTSSTRSTNFTVTDWSGSSSSASLSVGLHQTNRPALHARLHPAALARFNIQYQNYPTLAPLL